MNSTLFFQVGQIKHWMFPCIMCLQNFEKKRELEEFMSSNNIFLNATSEEIDLLGVFHTLLHTDENGLKTVILQHSVQFLHRLFKMCNVSDGRRVKHIMTSIEEVLNQRYVYFNYLKNILQWRKNELQCQSLWCPSYSSTSSQWLWRLTRWEGVFWFGWLRYKWLMKW